MGKRDLWNTIDDWIDEFGGNSNPFRSRNLTKERIGEFVGQAANAAIDAAYNAMHKRSPEYKEMERRRREYNELLKRIERTERRIEKEKKSTVVFLIMGIAFTLYDGLFEFLPLLFFSLSAFQYYDRRQKQEKLQKLLYQKAEYDMSGFLMENTVVPQNAEKTVLRYAHSNSGKVYPELMAIESELSLSEIERVLMICHQKQLASLEVDSNGQKYFYFPSFDSYDPFADLNKQ